MSAEQVTHELTLVVGDPEGEGACVEVKLAFSECPRELAVSEQIGALKVIYEQAFGRPLPSEEGALLHFVELAQPRPIAEFDEASVVTITGDSPFDVPPTGNVQ